jgi:hypothetical protein
MHRPIMQEIERDPHNHFLASEGRPWSISGGEKKLMENERRMKNIL